ncbi:hypothetical protein LOCC1_G003935 [Lachnellula occidentalis]|uniref:F-box domain-containing protein n=1 Tax=Lachnellula occidentalis TaxID=215460 RepID=A0A8H8UJ79_9HELO|nr:hypothetical protein LOCC1_G003935 [Lachnellula occidentalis]
MKWFKRKKTRSLEVQEIPKSLARYRTPQPSPRSAEVIAQLPGPILERIFSFICPHAQDETYDSCEQSAVEDTCMLCDLRDLCHCAQVSRWWRKHATNVLIRLDVVHYCELEDVLAEKRKHRSRLNRNAEPEDTAQARLRLLCRTLREDTGGFALNVQYFKTPFMQRETSKPDLARIAAVCSNLRYMDLPEGFFMDDPSCNTLKQEIIGRCPDMRKMTYMGGSERSLELLAGGNLWRNLEVLELSRINMDPTILRQALGSLSQLRALKVSNMMPFTDQLFQHSDYLAPFPPLTELIFEKTPNVTANGLTTYLFRSDVQNALKTLSLTETGVHPSTLQQVLTTAPKLEHLSITESVTSSIPTGTPSLLSTSLLTLHYEITDAPSVNSYASTKTSYYNYLTSSLLSRGLPNLLELYVRDPDFPETLVDLAPPRAPFSTDPDNFAPPNPFLPPTQSPSNPRFSSNNPFAKLQQSSQGMHQDLVVYSKGLDEMEWNFSRVQTPAARGRRGSASAPRPVSSYGLSENMGKSWGHGARKSVIVGNGFGGFLAVPADGEGRPSSSGSGSAGAGKRGSQYDMWR